MDKQQLKVIRDNFTFEQRLSDYQDYFKAAVLVPLIEIEGELHFLFEKRAANIKQGGEICFPGGKIEITDSSSLAAAIRETQEELGCDQEQITVLGRLKTLILASGVLINPYLGVLNCSLSELKTDPQEVDSIFTLPVDSFLERQPDRYDCLVKVHPYVIDSETNVRTDLLPVINLGLPERYQEPWGDSIQKIYAYQTESGVIWGLTAKVLYDCLTDIQELLSIEG